jgi:outer membrane protein assembly factor BamB
MYGQRTVRTGRSRPIGVARALLVVALLTGACADEPVGEAARGDTDPTTPTSAPSAVDTADTADTVDTADTSVVDAGTTTTVAPWERDASGADLRALVPRTGAERWQAILPTALVGTPIESGSTVVVLGYDDCGGTAAVLLGYDAGTGELRWEVPVTSTALCQPDRVAATPDAAFVLATTLPVIDASGRLVGDATTTVVAVDLATGAVRWEANAQGAEHVVAAGDDLLTTSQGAPALRVLDGATGEERWQASPGLHVVTASVVGDRVVAYGVETQDPPAALAGLAAFELATGEPSWHVTLGHNEAYASLASGEVVAAVVGEPGVATVHDPVDGDVLWRTDVQDLTERVAAGSGLIFVTSFGADGAVRAFAEATGEPAWSTQFPEVVAAVLGRPSASVVAITGFPGVTSSVHVVDAATGEELWVADATDAVGVGDNAVYLARSVPPSLVSAGDPATGEQVWQVSVDAAAQSLVGIVIADGVLYGQTFDCSYPGQLALAAYDASTGASLWRVTVPSGGEIGPIEPVSAADGIYVVPGPDAVVGVDVADGSVAWELPGWSSVGAIDGSVVVLAERPTDPSDGAALVGYDRVSGAERWRADLEVGMTPFEVEVVGEVAVAGALSGDGGHIEAFDLGTGSARWRRDGTFRIEATAGDVLAAVDLAGALVGIDAATGAERWRRDDLTVLDAPTAVDRAAGLLVASEPMPATSGTRQVLDVATGETAWTWDGFVGFVLAVRVGGLVVADTTEPSIVLLDPDDGTPLGRVPSLRHENDQITVGPQVGPDGLVYQARGCTGRG